MLAVLPQTLSLSQCGALFNGVAILIPAFFSLFIAIFHGQRYFREWTASLLLLAAVIPMLPLHELHPDSLALLLALASVYILHSVMMLKAGFSLQDRPFARWAVWLSVGTLAVTILAVLLRAPFHVAAALTTVFNIIAQCHLGGVLLRQARGQRRRWLAVLVVLPGLWALLFPAFEGSPHAWAGYVVAGVLKLLVGIGMVVFLLEDATDQVRAQNEALKQLDRLKTDFMATISHELRTPLTVIRGGAQLLDDQVLGALSPEQARVAASINANAERLDTLISDLLDYSRLEAGQMHFQLEPADLVPILEEAVRNLEPRFEARAIKLVLEIGSDDLAARVDGNKLYQVVTNLLVNACKFTPRGGLVLVRAQRGEDGVCIEVSDSGIGIAPEHHDQVFQKFFQVDHSSTREVDGTGLGLAICKAIVEKGHGGSISLESRPGHGSTFRVRLPEMAS